MSKLQSHQILFCSHCGGSLGDHIRITHNNRPETAYCADCDAHLNVRTGECVPHYHVVTGRVLSLAEVQWHAHTQALWHIFRERPEYPPQ